MISLLHMEAALFIPGHADVTTDISELVQKNMDKIYEIMDRYEVKL